LQLLFIIIFIIIIIIHLFEWNVPYVLLQFFGIRYHITSEFELECWGVM
jgi:hypothetical protein